MTAEPLPIESTTGLRSEPAAGVYSGMVCAWAMIDTRTAAKPETNLFTNTSVAAYDHLSGHFSGVEYMLCLASAQRLDVKLRAAGWRPASSGAPLAAHPIMPVQVARRRANSRRGSRLGRREKQRRTVNFNDELAGVLLAGATNADALAGD